MSGQVEFTTVTAFDGQTVHLMRNKNTGVHYEYVRRVPRDAVSVKLLNRPLGKNGRIYQTAEVKFDGRELHMMAWPYTGPRFAEERYGMRGHSGRASDRVYRWQRVINGTPREFSRIIWASGPVHVNAWARPTSTVLLHKITFGEVE